VAAIVQLAACQAVDIRRGDNCRLRSRTLRDFVRAHVPGNDADRRQDHDIAKVLDLYRRRQLPVGEAVLTFSGGPGTMDASGRA
jgi:histidine ammonia-lyase